MRNIIFIGILFFCSSMLLSCTSEIDKQLKKMILKENEGTPKMLNTMMRLDNVKLEASKTVQFNYTIMDDGSREGVLPSDESFLDTMKSKESIELNKGIMLSRLMKNPSPETKFYFDNDVTIIFSYSDLNGNFVYDMKITPEDYKK